MCSFTRIKYARKLVKYEGALGPPFPEGLMFNPISIKNFWLEATQSLLMLEKIGFPWIQGTISTFTL